MDHIRQNQFEALSFPEVTWPNTLTFTSLRLRLRIFPESSHFKHTLAYTDPVLQYRTNMKTDLVLFQFTLKCQIPRSDLSKLLY